MTRARVRLRFVVALGVALAISRVAVRGAAPALPAPSDTAITSRSIAFFEGRLVQDPDNFMVAGQLVARYMLRFQVSANLADVRRAESLARSGRIRRARTRGWEPSISRNTSSPRRTTRRVGP